MLCWCWPEKQASSSSPAPLPPPPTNHLAGPPPPITNQPPHRPPLPQLARERGLTTGPVAVVVPLSTFGSWEREMAKWAPGLEVLSYSGHQEARALIRK